MMYRAFWKDDHSKIIFYAKPADKVRRLLPNGARVFVSEQNTIGRLDGGDEYEFAMFEVDNHVIMVIPDPRQECNA